MNEPWLIYLLFFVSAALMVLFAHRYYTAEYTAKRQINRRLSLIEQTGDQKEALAILRRERGIGAGDRWYEPESVRTMLVQSGLRFQGINFILSIAGLFAVVTVIMTIALGLHPINVVLALVITVTLIVLFIRYKRDRRSARFNEQLPYVVELIVRSLKAGHPLPISLSLVAREMPDPAGTEFGIASDEVTYGLDLPSALRNLLRRVGDPDLHLIVMSATIQIQTGGNLSDILTRLSTLIRDRAKLRRKVRSITAEGRASALALTILPLAIFGVLCLIAPTYYGEVWNDPITKPALAIGIVMLAIGNFIMRRMVNFKY
jgi:tight adherence protein B